MLSTRRNSVQLYIDVEVVSDYRHSHHPPAPAPAALQHNLVKASQKVRLNIYTYQIYVLHHS